MSSTTVGTERVGKIVGYGITKGNFSNSTPNLPQRIAILAEANEANQATVDFTVPTEITSAQQAGTVFGFGSPVYQIARILKPISGNGTGGIPIFVYPQAKAVGATSKKWRITPAGTATGNATHTVIVGGRTSLDGQSYDINIVSGDTVSIISGKIQDAINAVIGCPLSGSSFGYDVDLESKWKGLTANGITVSVNTNSNAVGISYTVTSVQTAAGTPSISASLALFGNTWNTIVVNSYGTESSTVSLLNAFNGIPSASNPTGRFVGTLMKPIIAVTGSVADNEATFTDALLNDVTIAIAPAPLSKGLAMEAAANMTVLFARQAQDNPHLDVSGSAYPDMPTPDSIGTMSAYDSRDTYVKKGCTTVDLVNGKYQVEDFVTTYHPTVELPPQFRYCRNLMLDFNIRFAYYLLEQINVINHAIAADQDIVSAVDVIKPKQWKQLVGKMFDDLANRGLIADVPFSQDSLVVNISTTNPDRFETFYRYKRTGFVRIASTTAEAGFNFGN